MRNSKSIFYILEDNGMPSSGNSLPEVGRRDRNEYHHHPPPSHHHNNHHKDRDVFFQIDNTFFWFKYNCLISFAIPLKAL